MTSILCARAIRRVGVGVALCALTGLAHAVEPAFSRPAFPAEGVPSLPPAALAPTERDVLLELSVSDQGEVTTVVVVEGEGAAWELAFTEAARGWRLTPARRDGVPVASRVRVAVRVPAAPLTDAGAVAPEDAGVSVDGGTPEVLGGAGDVRDAGTSPPSSGNYLEVSVAGRRRREGAPSSEYTIELGALRAVPRKGAAEQLMLAPGVLTTNHGGEGHAHETYMRGFASKEGQDIEYLLDGVPLNDVSNPHGHGYADVNLVLPEAVRTVHVAEGPFDPEQGDFAFAGSASWRLGVDEKGLTARYGVGSFDTHRAVLTWAPADGHRDSFGAFEYYRTAGYGQNRAAQRALALGRMAGTLPGGLTWRLGVSGATARFDQPGVLRQDDYLAGRVGFFDTYDPNQGGETHRLLISFDTSSGTTGGRFRQATWLGLRSMRLRVNFTGWLTDVAVADDGTPQVQRGDALEMRYQALTGGSRGSYELAAPIGGLQQSLAVGYALRFDEGDSSQFRLRAVTAIPYARVFDDAFLVFNVAGWIRGQLKLARWLTARAGVRFDGFSFGVTDFAQADADREGARIPSQTSQAFGLAINPRASLDVEVLRGVHLVASYGQGTRSTEPTALSDNEAAPFARAQVLEAGATYERATAALQLQGQLGYVFTHVDKDMLFDPVSGRNVLASSGGSPVGPSTRHAALLSGRARYRGWLDALLNVGWSRGTLDATGELIPYIPELVVRLDAAVSRSLFGWALRGVPVTGRVGLGFTYVPGRPLPLGAYGDTIALLSASAEVRLWHLSLGVEGRNLLGLRYRQSEFNYVSNFSGPQAVASQRAVRHFTAGEPLALQVTATLHLEDLFRSSSTTPTPNPETQ